MKLVHWLALLFLLFVSATPLLGSLLHKRRVNREFRGHLESERRRVRLEKLTDLADEWDNAPTDAERKRVWIKASALGFTDDDREPFHLDTPRLPDNAA